jgi:ADP-dependent NAD(P)H-hydrate dehydratase / NAD(P)H-hydrate epimerase
MTTKRLKTFTARDAALAIVTPSVLDHKYSRGTLGVIAGSAQYPGAAVLTTSAALATGIGMVRFHSSSGLAHLVLHACPEVVVQPGPVTAWLAGPGISQERYSNLSTWLRHRWFTLMKRQSVPTVLDAGALRWAGKLNQPTLITPHAGELARLLKSKDIAVSAEAIEADPAKWAVKSSEVLGVIILLKGSQTVVADGERVVTLPIATPWLATAGSGDVLAGIIGALVTTNYIEILNQPERLADIAAAGAFIHNRAALAASAGGPISAARIIEFIPQVIQKLIA